MMTTRLTRAMAGLTCVMALAGPAGAGARHKVLGTDPRGDAPPALDLISLAVGRDRSDLVLTLGVAGMLPVVGGYESIPAIEWAFDAGSRMFITETWVESGSPQFALYEIDDNGQLRAEHVLEGSYEPDDERILIRVPLKVIGARRGTLVSGADSHEGEDANSHAHLVVTDHHFDVLATRRSYRVP